MSDTSKSLVRYMPRGATVLGLLLALYYGTVLLSDLRTAALQLLVLWGLVLAFMPSYRPSLTRGEWAVILSIAATFVVAVMSYAVNGLWSHPEANLSRYARFLLFIPIYLVARNFATSAGFWYALLLGTLATGVVGVLEFVGLVKYPGDLWTEVNADAHPVHFGELSLAMAMMTCSGLQVYRQRGRHFLLLAGFAVVVALFACVASNTRGAWVAIPALALLMCWRFLRGGFVRPRQLLAITVTGALLVAILLPQTDFVGQVQSAVQEVRDYGQGRIGRSAGFRFEMWRACWELFKRQPVLGIGPGLYETRVQELQAERGEYHPEALSFPHPHSEYFFVLATLGFVGVIALALLFLVPLYYFYRAMLSRDDSLIWPGLAGAVLVVGYLHFGLTDAMMYQRVTNLNYYLISVAVLTALIARRQSDMKEFK